VRTLRELTDRARELANELVDSDFVRCISHKDADGITSAGVLCTALYREGIPFHTTIVSRPSNELTEDINQEEDETVIFFDMGSGQPDIIKKIDKKVLVADHHPPEYRDEVAYKHLNPHHHGVDGSSEVSAAGLSYLIAREMNSENKDLSRIALAGAIGDRQHLPLKGVNKKMVSEGVENGVIEVVEGLRLYGDPVNTIPKSTDPYFENLDKKKKVRTLLGRLDIPTEQEINKLPEESKKKLIKTLSLMLLKQGANAKSITDLVGNVYSIKKGPVDYAADLTSLINSCARKERYGMALSLAMAEDSYVDKAREYREEYQKTILMELSRVRSRIKEHKSIRTVEVDKQPTKGTLASVTVNCLLPDKPVLAYYVDNDKQEVKVSARGNEKLIKRGVNLSKAMSKAADVAGGRGGGHNIASGASYPLDKKEVFFKEVDRVVSSQLGV